MADETVAEFARREGISSRRVRALIGDGRITARRVGGQWLVDRVSEHRPAPSRPLGEHMRRLVIAALSGHELPEATPGDRFRLRKHIDQLRRTDDPDRVLAGWLPQLPALKLAVAPSDLDDLALDARITKTGFSDLRSQIAAAGRLEARIEDQNMESLRREFLLRPSDQANVFVHVTQESTPGPLPLGLLLVDLAHSDGVRERSRVAELLREVSI